MGMSCSYHSSMKHTAPDKAVGIRVSHHQVVTPWATQGDISVAVVWAIIITSSGMAWCCSLQSSRTVIKISNMTALECTLAVCFLCIGIIKIMIRCVHQVLNILWYLWTSVICIYEGRSVCLPQFKVSHQHLHPDNFQTSTAGTFLQLRHYWGGCLRKSSFP
jgi:hypothetical protein